MRSDAWASALSWCNIQVWFSHNSGLFLRTASLKRAKTSWYNRLPSDHVVKIHDGQCLSNQKTQPKTPWSLNDSSVLFLVEETLSSSTATIVSWFQHHTYKPSLISCYGVLKNVFIAICTGKQFLTFQRGSLSDRQSTNAARILHWRDASGFF